MSVSRSARRGAWMSSDGVNVITFWGPTTSKARAGVSRAARSRSMSATVSGSGSAIGRKSR